MQSTLETTTEQPADRIEDAEQDPGPQQQNERQASAASGGTAVRFYPVSVGA